VVLSPAVKKGPRISPPTSPLSSQELQKKHKEAEERRLQREALRFVDFSAFFSSVLWNRIDLLRFRVRIQIIFSSRTKIEKKLSNLQC
jgi:hypothetical protein